MSHASLYSTDFTVDPVDECAPTEREPSLLGVSAPSRGVALSVLWWLDGDDGETADAADAGDRARD